MKISDTSKDFESIKEIQHIELVGNELKKTFYLYFKKITNSNLNGDINKKNTWDSLINKYLDDFKKESKKYKDFFSDENMEDYDTLGDAKVFKSNLRKECPIIHKTLFSKMEELQKWKEDFAHCKPQELLDIFLNFLDFSNDYSEKNRNTDYNAFTEIENFEEVAELSNEEDFVLRNVIGAGIRTTIIYNLYPANFCKSVRRTLYGLYFLTQDIHERIPSRTSEFIMIDDTISSANGRNSTRSLRIEHNYWYPYNLFMYYTNTIYMLLEEEFVKMGISLDKNYRYVYVNMFLELICSENSDYVKTMMGGDQDS
ncbi:hypothetical protein [Chryseobacterium nepalense]|uniref:hypothetical protein n=1 Tax=Chryseobacterium nepalense TaxID=1854498 RepID=UPI002DF74EE8|nr:hypothetical protein [Chryseobacterium nepalense]